MPRRAARINQQEMRCSEAVECRDALSLPPMVLAVDLRDLDFDRALVDRLAVNVSRSG